VKKKKHVEHAFGKNVKKNIENVKQNAKKMHLKIQLGRWNSEIVSSGLIFGGQFCCSYFAACPTSAG
jgi:hypothetical protein